MKVAIAFNTKDRTELSKRTIEPLLSQPCNVFWIDGSDTEEGMRLPEQYESYTPYGNIKGGPGMGMVFALEIMLNHRNHYTHVGLCEADTLLPDDWYDSTMELFAEGERDGLHVGAVSARCYEDRILMQRSNYAICHNLGAGHVMFTREAAEIVLQSFRSGWTSDNRRIFQRVSEIDIGLFWAFRGQVQFLTADWHWEAALACHGLAALALTPSTVEMIGQDPPLEQQGLKIARRPIERGNEDNFLCYRDVMNAIYDGRINLGIDPVLHHDADNNIHTFFAHQLGMLGGYVSSNGWVSKDIRRIGPLTYIAAKEDAEISIPMTGNCSFLVSGGEKGGKVKIVDLASGFEAEPYLTPESQQGMLLSVNVPGSFATRTVKLIAKNKDVRFYAVQSREPQVTLPRVKFGWYSLPK